MTKVYVVTDTVEDIYVGSSTTVAGVYSTMEKATEAVIKHKENTINEAAENGLVTSEIEELKAELNRCVEITETNLDE